MDNGLIGGVFHDRRPQPDPPPPRAKPFRATHTFQPVGLDAWDPRPHPGSQVIPAGTPVKRVAQLGSGKLAFHHITDREGNQMSVWKSSLQPKQMKRAKPPAE
jgi:hypothetical protein